jgi:hypothetical protein
MMKTVTINPPFTRGRVLRHFVGLDWHAQSSLPCAYSRPITHRLDSLPVHVSLTDIFAKPVQRNARRGSGWQLVQKLAQLGRGSELWNGIELLERARERIGETPHCPRRELVILRFEVQPVNF